MAVGDIGGNNAGTTADVRAQLVPLSLANVRALTASLAPGEILTGRVSADLGDGKVALTVRGQTIIASSQMPLPLDSVIKLLVHSTGDQPVLRLLTATFPDVATTTTTATRAAALGLPNTATTAIALQAFEHVGATLDPLRLKDAVAQLQMLPPAQMPQRALALALLADAGLPPTAPFIALAERSATGALPNPAAALAALKTTMPLLASTAAPTTERARPDEMIFQPTAKGNVAPPAFANGQPMLANGANGANGQPSPGPTAGTTVPSSSASTISPSVVQSQSVILVTKIPPSGQSVTTVTSLPASVNPASITSAPGAVAQPWSSSQSAPAAAAAHSAPPLATQSAPVVPGSAAASTLPTSPLSTPAVSIALAPRVLASSLIASGPLASTTAITSAASLLGTMIPDLERDGAHAAMQALSLAGVQPRHSAEARSAPVASPLIHRLGALVSAPDLPAQTKEVATRHESPIAMDAAVVNVMREQVAETMVKPRSLADYDVVLALPMQAHGQPTPARLAVAERHTAGGTATFVRVDAELTHLGPLSVRLSGIEGGPMAITLLATGPALTALVAALPNLSDSLRELGLTAGLRVADLAEDHPHG